MTKKQTECRNLEINLQEVQKTLNQTNQEYKNLEQKTKDLESGPKSQQNSTDQPPETGEQIQRHEKEIGMLRVEHRNEIEASHNRSVAHSFHG